MTLKDLDTWVGGGSVVLGSTGLTVQVLMDFASLAVVSVNLVLALGGAYLLYLRIRRARAALRELKEKTNDPGT